MKAWAVVVILVVGCGGKSDDKPPAEVVPSSTPAPVKVEAPPKTACERAADRFSGVLREEFAKRGQPPVEDGIMTARAQLLDECKKADWSAAKTGCYERAVGEGIDACNDVDAPTGLAISRTSWASTLNEGFESEDMEIEVRATGPGYTTARFIVAACNEKVLAFFLETMVENMRNVGFKHAECFDGRRVGARADL